MWHGQELAVRLAGDSGVIGAHDACATTDTANATARTATTSNAFFKRNMAHTLTARRFTVNLFLTLFFLQEVSPCATEEDRPKDAVQRRQHQQRQ